MINQERLSYIETLSLARGSHPDIEKGACIMEMVSYIADEPWSDHPTCACPILTSMAISINDRSDDETRQKLKVLITKLVGTRSNPATEKARAEFFACQAVTVTLPLLTDALDLQEVSERLRALKSGDWQAMRTYCYDIQSTLMEAAKKHNAAYAAANADAYAAAATAANAAYAAAANAANAAYAAAADAAYAAAAYAANGAAATAAAYAAHTSYAAASSTKSKKFWTNVKNSIWNAAIEGLCLACDINTEEKDE